MSCAWMYAGVYLCTRVCVCLYVCQFMCMCACVHIKCMYMCACVCAGVQMVIHSICNHAFMGVCIPVFIIVCMCIHECMHTWTHTLQLKVTKKTCSQHAHAHEVRFEYPHRPRAGSFPPKLSVHRLELSHGSAREKWFFHFFQHG